MNSNDRIMFPALLVSQPIGDYYIGVVDWASLKKITKTDVRRLVRRKKEEGESDEDDVFTYMGIQRPLSQARVREIKEYVKTIDACFPNTIILSIKSKYIEIDRDGESIYLSITNIPNAATVIDGQHRLAGFTSDATITFNLIVTVFVDMELQEQAYLFSTINTKHTKINPSLAKDLLEFSSIETPEKIAHNIAKSMNYSKDSPWFREIKMLGRKDEISQGIITQHAFTKEIIELIYPSIDHHNSVRSKLKETNNNRKKLSRLPINFNRYPFWEFYLEDHDDAIRKILENYFNAVKTTFPEDWINPRRILSKTTGYGALMRYLRDLIPIGKDGGSLNQSFFLQSLEVAKERMESSSRVLTAEQFGLGAAASTRLYKFLFSREELSMHDF